MAKRPQLNLDDNYQIPSRGAVEDDKLEYVNYCIARGLEFLKGQPAYADIEKGRQIVHSMETYDEAIPDKLSHCRVPRIKRQIKEIVATLSNLRPTVDYTSNNPAQYESQANVLNKLYRAWYYREEVDRSIRQALQYAATEGTGYLYLTWEKPLRASTGRIVVTPISALNYIPFQQSLNNKVQDAEVGIVCTEIPVAKARRLYKLPDLQPTNSTATNLVSGVRELITNVMSPYLRAAGPNRKRSANGNTPTVNIYHLYIKDDSINESGKPIKMGEFKADGDPATSFSYIVPYVGQPIPTGRYIAEYTDGQPKLNPMTNEPALVEETRLAEQADCLIYPNLRLIMATPEKILYDGPSMWWHGKIPIVQFRMDDWPWNFLGFSLVRDTWRLEESITGRLRARDDATNAALNPALMYDSRMSDQFDKNFTPRIPGGRIVKPPMVDKPVETVLPWQTYQVNPNVDAEIMADEKRLDFLMGLSEVDQLMKLKQLPQSESLDKLIGASTALIVDIARNMESSLSDFGEMWKVMAMQYCNPPEAPIWMADYSFKPIGDLKIGDEIIGWKTGVKAGRGGSKPKLCKATVTATGRRTSEIVKVTMESGATIRCTPDHLWWLFRKSKSHEYAQAEVGRHMTRVVQIPEDFPAGLDREAGWLAGVMDGEGTFPRIPQSREKNPEIFDNIAEVLKAFNLPYTLGKSAQTGEYYFLTGGRDEYVKFANWIRPTKRGYLDKRILISNFGIADRIVRIEPDGSGEVVSLTTTTGNYVVWGYASKNCTVQERYRMLGEDGLTMEDFDFDPGNMIPSHLPGEDPSKDSRATKFERARAHVDTFQFNVIPNSLTQITNITRKMLYMQMWRDKTVPMDIWTFAEVMEIPNVGPQPQGTKNMIERWKVWMQEYAETMQQVMGGMAGGEGQEQFGERPGRKPTGQTPPHLSHGGRTIAESK